MCVCVCVCVCVYQHILLSAYLIENNIRILCLDFFDSFFHVDEQNVATIVVGNFKTIKSFY